MIGVHAFEKVATEAIGGGEVTEVVVKLLPTPLK